MRIKCPLEDSEVGHTIVDKCWHFDFTYEHCTTGFITVTDTQMTTNVRQNFGFHLLRDDRTALGGVQLGLITLSSWHPLGVHVIFFQILKKNNPKECAISCHSTALGHIITATFALKSRARHCS